MDPTIRRDLIVDAAERLLATQDPLLLSFEEVSVEAGVSRPLVHAYLGDRRGLLDAVQVRLVARLDTWVGHGVGRASDADGALRALVGGVFAFVEADHEAWGVLVASGGLDHPALHGARQRWVDRLCDDDPARTIGAQAAVAALLLGVGGWVNRGTDPSDVTHVLLATLGSVG